MGQAFARKRIPALIRPKRLKILQNHLDQGHRCILISASIELYTHPWAEAAGFSNALTSQLEVDNEGKITGKLKGKNCRGPEKVRRLEELLGPKSDYILYAYGDSAGDRQLLEVADHPTLF
jgi:HAD superfamily hydrolase (TIGR01490 family)